MDSIKVKSPLWGGYKLFNWDKKEPFVGLSKNKLMSAGDDVEIELEYRHLSLLQDKQNLIAVAEKNNWVGYNGGLQCYYYPESILVEGKIS